MEPEHIQDAELAPGPELERKPSLQSLRREKEIVHLKKTVYRLLREIKVEQQKLREIRKRKQRTRRNAGGLRKGPRHLQSNENTTICSQLNLANSKDKAYTSTSENFAARTVRMATFRRCTCQLCPNIPLGQTHLSIETTAIELRKENGIAISYAWGQFDRTKHCIGHRKSHPTEEVWLELGAEWRVNSILERLVQLTEKHGACWIDQVCFPQKSDQLRHSLVQVPAIFRTLPVIILCPGSLCSCLRLAYQAISERAPANSSTTDGTVYTDTMGLALYYALRATDCLNSNGACSWSSRIWTNQEFRYSRCVKMVYAEVEEAECCLRLTPLQTQLEKMNDYSRLLHLHLKDKLGLNDFEALEAVRHHHQNFPDAFSARTVDEGMPDEMQAAFLLGETQVIASENAACDTYDSIMDEINAVARGRLSASQPKDYVLSLFAEWDFYVAPSGFQDMPINMLLKDLLRQLRKVQPVLIPTRCPAGLFGISSETWSFDASDVTSGRKLEDVRHIYGVFEWWNGVDSQTPGRLPIKRLGSSRQSCASNAPSVASWLARHNTMTGFVWFCSALSCWEFGCARSIYDLEGSMPSMARLADLLSSDDPLKQIQGCRAFLMVVAREISLVSGSGRAADTFLDRSHQRLSEMERNVLQQLTELVSPMDSSPDPLMAHLFSMPLSVLEEAVFELTCELLLLDARLCRERGVRAILGEWHPLQDQGPAPDVAMSENKNRSNYGPAQTQELGDDVQGTQVDSKTCIGLVHWETLCQARAQQQDTMTIALRTKPHVPFYEAVRTSGCGSSESAPEYKVFGVWMPLPRGCRAADIGAVVVDEDEADAFVV